MPQEPANIMQVDFIARTGPSSNLFQTSRYERRDAPRRQVQLAALVVNREFNTIFRCEVRDISETGARLDLPDSFLVPAGFWLIGMSAGLAYDAKLAWRRDPNAGVSVGEPIDLRNPLTRLARSLRNVWADALI